QLEVDGLGGPAQRIEVRQALEKAMRPESRAVFEERLREITSAGRAKLIENLRLGYKELLNRNIAREPTPKSRMENVERESGPTAAAFAQMRDFATSILKELDLLTAARMNPSSSPE